MKDKALERDLDNLKHTFEDIVDSLVTKIEELEQEVDDINEELSDVHEQLSEKGNE
jgi:uncharacterized protein (UPF0335 family)